MRKINFLRSVVKMTVACLTVAVMLISCGKDGSSGSLGGKQSPIGKVGNTFTITSKTPGVSGISAKVVDLDNGVSTVAVSVNITNSTYLTALAMSPDIEVSGNKMTINPRGHVTSNGIQEVLPDGTTLTLVKANAKVGDVYTNSNSSLRREVTKVSKENDYTWNGMQVKTIHIKETGRGIPGLDYIEFLYNEELGLVGCKFFLEDGTVMDYPIASQATNVVSNNKPIGGSQSPMGQVGTSFSMLGSIPGVSGVSAQVTALKDGVSTITASSTITNSTYMALINNLYNLGVWYKDDVTISGTKVTVNAQFRITDKGIQSVYPDGNVFTAVEYSAKVGDVYTVQLNGQTIRREVTAVSTTDDFAWNGMKIKTITIKETGRGIPGVDYIEYWTNHKFGPVAARIYFEDGTSVMVGCVTN